MASSSPSRAQTPASPARSPTPDDYGIAPWEEDLFLDEDLDEEKLSHGIYICN